jgi:NitT/TauT family transport system substrate-binding protein
VVLTVDSIKGIRNLPAIVAERLGYFKDEGQIVTLTEMREDVAPEEMLVDGRIDGVVAFYHHVLLSQAEGKTVESVITLAVSPGFSVVVATRLKDKVHAPADLQGMKIGAGNPTSGTGLAARWLMASAGLQTSDYTIVPLAAPDKTVQALNDGGVDATIAHHPDPAYYLSQGAGFVLADLNSADATSKALGNRFPTTSLYMANAYVKTHADAVQHLVNAFERALQYINAHSAEDIMALMPKSVVGKNKAGYLESLRVGKQMFATDGVMADADARMELKVLSDIQPQCKGVRIEETYTNEFIGNALKSPK